MSTEATVSAAGMRIVKLLVGNPPQTVADLIEATGVTRTAVTEQLNELVAAGFVERNIERLPGRGRPRHIYSTTNAALLLFAGNQSIVVPAVWRAIEEFGGGELKQQVLTRVSLALADHYRRQINGRTPAERLRQFAQLLREGEGNLVEIEKGDNGHLVMRRRSCSFFSMFEESRSVCRVDEEMLSAVIGAPVRRTASRHDGAPCCTFELVSSDGD